MPDEKEKRHGQAMAAASLPVIGSKTPASALEQTFPAVA
jgi:hypothetical protein